jgi:hypothetical protein
VPAIPDSNEIITIAAVENAILFRRANFRSRYAALGGHATTGSSFKYR